MGHGKGTIQPVKIHFSQVEKLENQFAKFPGTIRGNFETNGVATAGTTQFLFDGPEKIICFLFVDVEIAVPCDAEGVRPVKNKTRKEIGNMVRNQGRKVNVFPWFVV